MAEGKKSEYEKIKGTPVFEFWQIFDLWKTKVKQDNERLKSHKNKK